MSDYLLRGLREIHQEIFKGKDGKPVISFETFDNKFKPDMLAMGVLFKIVIGALPDRREYICGWISVIKNYFTILGRNTELEKKNRGEG